MVTREFEDCASAIRDGDYDKDPYQVFFFNVLQGDPIPDWLIRVPKKYIELIIDRNEETEDAVVIRLRRKMTPELVEYRSQIGVTV